MNLKMYFLDSDFSETYGLRAVIGGEVGDPLKVEFGTEPDKKGPLMWLYVGPITKGAPQSELVLRPQEAAELANILSAFADAHGAHVR